MRDALCSASFFIFNMQNFKLYTLGWKAGDDCRIYSFDINSMREASIALGISPARIEEVLVESIEELENVFNIRSMA